MEKFGPMIRELRLSKGLTLNELAKDIVSVPFLSKFSNHRSKLFHRYLLLTYRKHFTYLIYLYDIFYPSYLLLKESSTT